MWTDGVVCIECCTDDVKTMKHQTTEKYRSGLALKKNFARVSEGSKESFHMVLILPAEADVGVLELNSTDVG